MLPMVQEEDYMMQSGVLEIFPKVNPWCNNFE